MPAIAGSVEVVVAIACTISLNIGGRAFTGNGRRFVPSGRNGVGVAHDVGSFIYLRPFCYRFSRLSPAVFPLYHLRNFNAEILRISAKQYEIYF